MVGGTMPSRTANNRRHHFERAGGAKRVADHGLGRRDRELWRVRPERLMQRLGLGLVVGGGAGAVSVDVLDICGREFRVGKRVAHRPHHAALIGRGEIGRIGAHAKADDFAEYLRAARLRALKRLEHHHGGTLAENKAHAVFRERPADIG